MVEPSFVNTVWQHLRHVLGPAPAPRPPVILDVPEGMDFQELVDEVSGRAGSPRTLIDDGRRVEPVNTRTGQPLVEPFGEELLEMRAWPYWNDWIGCARVVRAGREQAVVVLAHRADPAAEGLPEGASWTEKLRLLTGWEPLPRTPVDWQAAEQALGTRLPGDYKEIADLFGYGSFDTYLELLVPGVRGLDLVQWATSDAAYVDDLWRPHARFPEPEGLLRWGSSEQELDFVWQTGAPDPDEWTVLVRTDFDTWERYDCGMGEFLVRLLTDVALGYPTSRIAAHCFADYA
ncbi:SMI1/KNR4 family protein [Streptomyces sp. NBC_01220]|uniref:SMI1/KNR4 family protein n=1 Tax=Streptomyces sp. NBC_01220 TaxID=2903781 RepID=UPI00352C6C96|nr:SMI1/KNR4 family protein [Streptomyces sp. NBC_01220]